MMSTNYNIPNKKYQHFSYEKRQKLEALLSANVSIKNIANILNFSVRTIQREIKRGLTQQLKTISDPYGIKEFNKTKSYFKYTADKAQAITNIAKSAKGPREKLGNDFEFVNYVEELFYKGYSPYAIIQSIKNEKLNFKTQISVRTLYNYIYKGYFSNISAKDLPERRKNGEKGKRKRLARNNTKGRSIEERPKEVDARQTFGHWEIDLILGKKGTKNAILSMVERQTRYLICVKIESKRQDIVQNTIKEIIRNRREFKSITADNGSEFLGMDEINGAKVYYAHPYSSWERGTNERTNRIIRRFIKKSSDISKYDDKYIMDMVKWINNYPRKILNGRTPQSVYEEKMAIF